jgi:hypothetical protein
MNPSIENKELVAVPIARFDFFKPVSPYKPTDISTPDSHLSVPDGILLRGLCHENSNQLNSRKVINRFVSALKDVPQYEKSELGRNGSAAVLNLKSYTWSFDIVPGFFTTPEADNRTFYIIPDGNGHWMKTDPRIDKEKVTSVNQKHDGNVLNVIRTIKYWNRRATMPSMRPYLID